MYCIPFVPEAYTFFCVPLYEEKHAFLFYKDKQAMYCLTLHKGLYSIYIVQYPLHHIE